MTPKESVTKENQEYHTSMTLFDKTEICECDSETTTFKPNNVKNTQNSEKFAKNVKIKIQKKTKPIIHSTVLGPGE